MLDVQAAQVGGIDENLHIDCRRILLVLSAGRFGCCWSRAVSLIEMFFMGFALGFVCLGLLFVLIEARSDKDVECKILVALEACEELTAVEIMDRMSISAFGVLPVLGKLKKANIVTSRFANVGKDRCRVYRLGNPY